MPLDAGTMTRQIGAPQAEHLQNANQMIGDMPAPLLNAAREPFAAQAVIFALLLSRDDEAVRDASNCRCFNRRSRPRCFGRRSNWPPRRSRCRPPPGCRWSI